MQQALLLLYADLSKLFTLSLMYYLYTTIKKKGQRDKGTAKIYGVPLYLHFNYILIVILLIFNNR